MNKIIKSLILLSLPLSLVSCTHNDNDKNISTRDVDFVNLCDNYVIENKKIKSYFVDDVDMPYIDVVNFVVSLDGLFKTELFVYGYRKLADELRIGYTIKGTSYLLATINWKKNTFKTPGLYFSSVMTKESATTDYSMFFKNVYNYQDQEIDSITFDLNKYGFDILYYGGKCLMPLFVLNTLFCSSNYYNVFYNHDKYYGYYGEISINDPEATTILNSSKKNAQFSSELRKYSYNSLLFSLDYMYGLKGYKEVNNFDEFISSENKDKILSTNPETNLDGYNRVIYQQLNELHSRVDLASYYIENPSYMPLSERGSKYTSYYSRRDQLSTLRTSVLGENPSYPLISDDRAFISFDSFKTGTKEQIYNEDGSISENAHLYDSFFYLKRCLDEVKTHEEVKNVILDVSLNGGGNVAALIRVLGLLTDSYIQLSTYETLSKIQEISYFSVDADCDGEYDEHDAYEGLNFYVLAGENTFSAANAFVSNVKENEYATVIGKTSGGGMCSVVPLVLVDGTAITISSTNAIGYYTYGNGGEYVFNPIEGGVTPTIEIEYENFYDFANYDLPVAEE